MEGKPTGRVPACLAPKREAHEPNGDSVAPLSSSARDRGGVADGWNSRSHEVVAPKAEAPRGASSHGAVPPGRAASVGGNARADSALLPHQRLFTSAPRAKVARTSEPKASVGARNGTAIPTERKAPRQFNMRNLERPPPAVVAPKRDARTSSTHDDEGERRSLSFGEWRQSSGSREKEGRMGRRGRSPPPVGNAFMTARSRYHGDVDPERADDASTRHGAAAAPDPSLVQPYRPPAFTSTTGSRPARAGEKGRRQPVTGGGGDDTKTFSNRTLTLLKLGADDELPETLEGLDRQFIERVCNEVVGTGVSLQWDDIAGCTETKKIIQEVVLYPIINPSLFTGILSPPKGILLFGPPGTGKTMIGKAIASNIHATFFSISATSLTSKWIGEGEMMVRTLFAVARHVEPSVIFIDEIDSLLSSRKSDGEHESSRKMKNQFLVEMDGVSNGKAKNSLLIVGATNRPEEIDEVRTLALPHTSHMTIAALPSSRIRRPPRSHSYARTPPPSETVLSPRSMTTPQTSHTHTHIHIRIHTHTYTYTYRPRGDACQSKSTCRCQTTLLGESSSCVSSRSRRTAIPSRRGALTTLCARPMVTAALTSSRSSRRQQCSRCVRLRGATTRRR